MAIISVWALRLASSAATLGSTFGAGSWQAEAYLGSSSSEELRVKRNMSNPTMARTITPMQIAMAAPLLIDGRPESSELSSGGGAKVSVFEICCSWLDGTAPGGTNGEPSTDDGGTSLDGANKSSTTGCLRFDCAAGAGGACLEAVVLISI